MQPKHQAPEDPFSKTNLIRRAAYIRLSCHQDLYCDGRCCCQTTVRNATRSSARPRQTDIVRAGRHVSKVPGPEMVYVLAANESHRPGRPFSSNDPRSANFKSASARRSVTTSETRTSFEPECAISQVTRLKSSGLTPLPRLELRLAGCRLPQIIS